MQFMNKKKKKKKTLSVKSILNNCHYEGFASGMQGFDMHTTISKRYIMQRRSHALHCLKNPKFSLSKTLHNLTTP